MTVSLTLPPDVEKRIQSEAAQRSVPVEDYIVWLLSLPTPASDEQDRRKRALAGIDALAEIGTQEEQRETFEYLARVIDEDRLSDRRRFQ
jgi:hypothetical protein